ncbi:hypothetical protein LY90DRAFT_663128 [Neocallimastix californiae]|uniref:Uncharacterized protein n=1 Tax=Neocallimastix californiae TaxID=1754190 RepID=A0A1Y2FRB6_9FUNG|nr:hypothetical protein LY90DRAFT_663128 [Neocallimastix californiae]|eukprot:ORY86479.1 hypothetical protein LY90DRAFT_663128 [Neocallimastix californiae]
MSSNSSNSSYKKNNGIMHNQPYHSNNLKKPITTNAFTNNQRRGHPNLNSYQINSSNFNINANVTHSITDTIKEDNQNDNSNIDINNSINIDNTNNKENNKTLNNSENSIENNSVEE